jgi:hypothetical protein
LIIESNRESDAGVGHLQPDEPVVLMQRDPQLTSRSRAERVLVCIGHELVEQQSKRDGTGEIERNAFAVDRCVDAGVLVVQ